MKTKLSSKLIIFCIIAVNSLLFSGCLKDKCEKTYHYIAYTPVYISEAELRSSIAILPAEDIVAPGKIFYKSPYIFVNELNKGIHIINNIDPSNPQNIAFIKIPGNIDISVKNNTLYADSYIDLVALDITDPQNVTEVGRVENVFPQREYEGWTADPDLGVVVDFVERDTLITEDCNYSGWSGWNGGVFFASMEGTVATDGGSTVANSPGYGVAGSMTRFTIVDDHLYCVTPSDLKLFDISDPSTPQQGSTISLLSNVETIFPYENYLFIGTTTGIQIYNNAVPESPVYVSQFLHMTSCDPVIVSGNTAYSTLRSGTECGTFNNDRLDIIDISNIADPVLTISYEMTHPMGLGLDGNKLFLCDEDLKMYDVSDPMQMELLQTINISSPYDVIALGGILILVSESAITQYDYSSGSLVKLSELSVIRDM